MEPSIEIWDLDIVCEAWILLISYKFLKSLIIRLLQNLLQFSCSQIDEVQPSVVLGGVAEEKKKKKGKKVCYYIL